jgi:hypothetical protein
MTKASTQPLKYISDFMKKNCSEEIIDTWNNDFKDGFIKLIDKGVTKKVKKSADAPKGHRSAYILFCMEDRPKVNEEFPDLTSQEKVSLMSQRWKIAKEDPKLFEYYNDLAAKDRERAAAEKEAYVPPTEDDEDDDDEEEKVVEKKKTKRTKTGYQLFCQENRESVKDDGYTGKEITEELNKRWKALKEDDEDMYAEYMEKAATLKKNGAEEETPAPKKTKKKKEDVEEKPAPKTKKVPTKSKNKVTKKIFEDDDEDIEEED